MGVGEEGSAGEDVQQGVLLPLGQATAEYAGSFSSGKRRQLLSALRTALCRMRICSPENPRPALHTPWSLSRLGPVMEAGCTLRKEGRKEGEGAL